MADATVPTVQDGYPFFPGRPLRNIPTAGGISLGAVIAQTLCEADLIDIACCSRFAAATASTAAVALALSTGATMGNDFTMETDLDPNNSIIFTCNICGMQNREAARQFHREIPNCRSCGSTPRFRGIVHALSLGLAGKSRTLPNFPAAPHLRGVGMSEWEGYAHVLGKKFSFTNTYFHQEPRLDITSDDWRHYTDLDFLICSEVFEHVLQPLEVGFVNMRRMLKKGGTLVFSAPFTSAPLTTEHFPGMTEFATLQMNGRWLVISRKADGCYDVYDKGVVFHGGPGTVLEMRIFSQNDLISQLRAAGFEVEILSQPAPGIGYYWPSVMERPEIGYPGLNYIMLCRAV